MPSRSKFESILRELSLAHLAAIGVSGEPPDPSSSFSDLESDRIELAWLSGAVHPITMRGLAAILISGLPPDLLGELSDLFLQASGEQRPNELPPKHAALNELAKMLVEELDCYPNEPFVSINPAASGRQVAEALSELLPRWKAERQLQEQRDRSDKYPLYLDVWDRREGWTGGGYDSTKEGTFAEIAGECGQPLSTVESHYLRAFELITGHPFSRALWYKLFTPLKFTALFGQDSDANRVKRPLLDPTRRPIPESDLVATATDCEETSPLAGRLAAAPDDGVERLIAQIRLYIDQGRTDRQIADDLGLSDVCLDAVAALRRRDRIFFEFE